MPADRRADLLLVLAALLPLAAFVLAERRIAGAYGFPLDDSWIHLHFARNIAEGAGFAYNPGHPMAGSTSPLWTLLLAAAVALGGGPLLAAKVLGVAASLAAALATRRAAIAWGASPLAALGAGVAWLWAPGAAWGALSGMEVSLAALLVAGTFWAHGRDRLIVTSLGAALATLARPEAAILVPLLVLSRPLTRRRAVVSTVVTGVVLLPVVAFNLLTVGAPLPATAAAKIEGGLVGWFGGVPDPLPRLLVRPWTFFADWVGWLAATHPLLPLLGLGAVVLAWRRHGRALGVPALALVLHPVAMAWLAPFRGPGFQEGRYALHLLPLLLIAAAAVLGPTLAPPAWRRAREAALALWLALALVPLPAAAERYGWGVQNINAMQVHLGRWVDAHLPRRARLALNDIGAIAFISRREVIDLMGLVTPDIIPYRRQGEAGVIRYVTRACPDYVIVFPSWFPELTARRDLLEPLYRVRLERNVVAGGPEMVVYRLTRCAV